MKKTPLRGFFRKKSFFRNINTIFTFVLLLTAEKHIIIYLLNRL